MMVYSIVLRRFAEDLASMGQGGGSVLIGAAQEIDRLNAQVTDLQSNNSKLVMERQKANAYGNRARRQSIVLSWVKRVFGNEIAASPQERAMRLLEEATEAAQAIGVSWKTASDIVTYVFSRPSGDVRLELGGVAVTLMAFCEAIGVNVEDVERDELERALSLDEEKIFAKHRAKIENGIAVPT
jgi:hypothetical protein